MTPLITPAQLLSALPDLTAGQQADAPNVIDAISEAIVGRFPKLRPPQDYDEKHLVAINRLIQLHHKPVQSINLISTDLDGVITITNTDPTNRAARVTVNEVNRLPVSMTLATVRQGVASVPITIPFTECLTFTQLAAAINSIPGWTTALAEQQEDLETTKILPGWGTQSAMPSSSGAMVWAYTRELNNFTPDNEKGQVTIYEWRMQSYQYPYRTWGIDPRTAHFRFQYTAGFPTPPDVIRAAIMWVKEIMDRTPKPGGIAYEGSPEYSYRLSTQDIPDPVWGLLKRFRERSIS